MIAKVIEHGSKESRIYTKLILQKAQSETPETLRSEIQHISCIEIIQRFTATRHPRKRSENQGR